MEESMADLLVDVLMDLSTKETRHGRPLHDSSGR